MLFHYCSISYGYLIWMSQDAIMLMLETTLNSYSSSYLIGFCKTKHFQYVPHLALSTARNKIKVVFGSKMNSIMIKCSDNSLRMIGLCKNISKRFSCICNLICKCRIFSFTFYMIASATFAIKIANRLCKTSIKFQNTSCCKKYIMKVHKGIQFVVFFGASHPENTELFIDVWMSKD